MFRLQDTYLQNPLSIRLWPPDALLSGFFDFWDPKISQMRQLGIVAGEVGQLNVQIWKDHVSKVSNLEKN